MIFFRFPSFPFFYLFDLSQLLSLSICLYFSKFLTKWLHHQDWTRPPTPGDIDTLRRPQGGRFKKLCKTLKRPDPQIEQRLPAASASSWFLFISLFLPEERELRYSIRTKVTDDRLGSHISGTPRRRRRGVAGPILNWQATEATSLNLQVVAAGRQEDNGIIESHTKWHIFL